MKLRFQTCLGFALAASSTLSAQQVDVAVVDETLSPIHGLNLQFELEDGRVLASALAFPGRYHANLGTEKSRLTITSPTFGEHSIDLLHAVDSDIVIHLSDTGVLHRTYDTQLGMFAGNPTAISVGDAPALPNPTCHDALPFPTVPFGLPGTNIGGGIAAGLCDGLFGGFGAWYSVIGTGETMTASTCNLSSFNSGIRVYSGCGLFDCLGGSDDGCSNDGASFSWDSDAGVEYKILVHGFLLEAGVFFLTVDSEEPEPVCEVAATTNLSVGCGANLNASLPILGGTGTLSFGSENIFAQGFVFLGDPSVEPYMTLGCEALVLPTSLFQSFSTGPDGSATLTFPLPADTSFCGEQFVLQAAARSSFTAIESEFFTGEVEPADSPAISNAILISLGVDPGPMPI